MSVGDLLARYSTILDELERRNVIRARNAPAGDHAERLCARALGGSLLANSQKSADVVFDDGTTVQVKCRVVSDPIRTGERQMSVFRSWNFELAAFVLLDRSSYRVRHGVLLPAHIVESSARSVGHVNGHRFILNGPMLNHPDAQDITEALRSAADAHA
ncbi:MAG: hypothetical protein ABJH68_07390 [Ilumatobacter sp.]|uniref:hypothetical protein n=1 Tax=Ilumatobacter sp. TaxID=1967498 RepID=UPI003297F7FF